MHKWLLPIVDCIFSVKGRVFFYNFHLFSDERNWNGRFQQSHHHPHTADATRALSCLFLPLNLGLGVCIAWKCVVRMNAHGKECKKEKQKHRINNEAYANIRFTFCVIIFHVKTIDLTLQRWHLEVRISILADSIRFVWVPVSQFIQSIIFFEA